MPEEVCRKKYIPENFYDIEIFQSFMSILAVLGTGYLC